jgi:hypothetical protein
MTMTHWGPNCARKGPLRFQTKLQTYTKHKHTKYSRTNITQKVGYLFNWSHIYYKDNNDAGCITKYLSTGQWYLAYRDLTGHW